MLLHGFAGGKEHWVWVTKYLAEKTAEGSELVEKIYNDLDNQPAPLESALNKLTIPTLIL